MTTSLVGKGLLFLKLNEGSGAKVDPPPLRLTLTSRGVKNKFSKIFQKCCR